MTFEAKIQLPNDAELRNLMDAAGAMKRYQAADKVVTAMAKIVVARARELAPRSRGPSKRSRSQARKAEWDYPLWRTISYIVRRTAGHAYAIVGPAWPRGQKAHFNIALRKGSRRVWYWGKDQGRSVPAIRNYLVQAADESRSQMAASAKVALQKFLKDTYGG